MTLLRGDPAASRLAVRAFQAKLVACVALAALPLALVLLSRGLPASDEASAQIGVALAAAVLAVLLAWRLVQPLGAVSTVLRDCLSDAPHPAPPRAHPSGAGGMVGDATLLAARIDAMRQRLSNRHPITGLPTREPFLALLAGEVTAGDRAVLLGVIRFADYDRLAAFDQEAADQALRGFAARLSESMPGSRPLAQVDRDCFAVWFSDAANPEAAAGELQAVGYVLGQPMTDGGIELSPDVGMGAAVFPDDGGSPAELLTRAIAALGAPRQGPDARLAFFSAQTSEAARERFSLEQDLRGAVARDQFLLHYQPVVDLEAGRVVGAEALLRWRHPTLGLVPPDRFIPVLEDSGTMPEVGLWVLNAACREARAWREQGLEGLKMAVNLSTTQCRDPRLNGMVMRTLERHGLEPSSLELELTETTAMEDADHTRRLLTELRAQGVSVAIDDFGAGYSSMSYLKNLPFSKLKIDREFVTDVNALRDSRAICASLIELARGLGIAVLAEGVETLDEVETLQGMGCRLFQGFFFSRPLDAAAFVRTVKDPEWLAQLGSPARRQITELTRQVAG